MKAAGNVVLGYQDREIRAQNIEYNQDSKIINAENGVQYTDSTKTILKAKTAIVTDTMDRGEMKNVEVDMPDGSKFFADNLTITGREKYDLTKAYYQPCDSCYDGQQLWQVDADKIVYDGDKGRVYYRDVYMEALGEKLVWLPYISHPTPFAQSKSGFLSPKFGQSSQLGTFAQVPYYYQPRSNIDFTITPYMTTEDGLIMILEHRHLMEDGYYQIEVSGAYPRERDSSGHTIPGAGNEFRGNIKTKGDFRLAKDSDWGYGWDINRATDDTYLSRYHISTYEDVLTSELYTNYLSDRDYFSMKALAFQGLTATDNPAISPTVLPLINAGKTYDVSEDYNQKFEMSFNGMNLNRDVGADSIRAIGKGAWTADYVSTGGHIFNFNMNARADHYNVENVPYLSGQYNGAIDRMIPTGSVKWSFPVQKVGQSYGLVLEPTTMFVVSPNGNNNFRIPNEDSQNIELYDYNLFQEDHISGYDLVEDGPRADYGLRGSMNTENLGDYNFLLGQTYRLHDDPAILGPASGMEDNLSDYVGRISTGSDKVQTAYRFRVDKDDFEFRRNEISLGLTLKEIQLNTAYTFIDGTGPTDPTRQEIYTNSSIKLTDKWNLLMDARRNMDNDQDAGWVNVGGGFGYVTSCVNASVQLEREFTRDRDIQPSTDIIFKVNLANFGS